MALLLYGISTETDNFSTFSGVAIPDELRPLHFLRHAFLEAGNGPGVNGYSHRCHGFWRKAGHSLPVRRSRPAIPRNFSRARRTPLASLKLLPLPGRCTNSHLDSSKSQPVAATNSPSFSRELLIPLSVAPALMKRAIPLPIGEFQSGLKFHVAFNPLS